MISFRSLLCLPVVLIASTALGFQPPKPIVSTPVVTENTPGHSMKIEANIKGEKNLYLVVTDGGNGFGSDWADWAEPKLVGSKGELKLTDLKWKTAEAGWGKVEINRNADGGEMRINGKPVEYGIGTHANSVIHFELPEGYDKFIARAGLDNGGTDQGMGTSVQFHVYTQAPGPIGGSSASPVDRTPENAVAGLDIAEGLEVSLFAAEPVLLSPSNIDIDHMGRVWVCEVVNYRRFANGSNKERPEGDRILVLEDTNGDGMADKETVFYQGRDIDSAHGVCVLGNRVIVSAGDSVFSFYDDNGDLKSDRKEVMFTGIKGVQHDHGIHSFQFGPDGRLYFNFGNAGEELHNPDGSIVVDVAGNEVRAARKPYQEGMAFRCELDGSKVDTLGWNFRNNWELCVDSFGTVWQSDNDDDGNKGVRINYVMEYGNYGYKDEITGAGWQTPRTNMEEEIPLRHWHLNDPGVVPNLLQTGAGSPTGIMIYEGDKLPERFINQLIHCDAGPNIVRSYAVTDDGAGYKAEINDILNGTRDQWFRPSDVCVAPDGSLIVADWYDPGVGGHRQGDIDRGRLFRVSLPGQKYSVPKHDFSTVEGAAAALKSPNNATRYLAFTKLKESGAAAEAVLAKMFESDPNPRFRARALWLLGQIEGKTQKYVDLAIADKDKDIRITGIRLARRMGADVIPVIEKLTADESPQVRRECAIALRHVASETKIPLWTSLALSYGDNDRWYLESLGIAMDSSSASGWNAALTSLLKTRKDANPANFDLIWRSRGTDTTKLKLAELIHLIKRSQMTLTPEARHDTEISKHAARLFRSLDFDDKASAAEICGSVLRELSGKNLPPKLETMFVVECLARITSDQAAQPSAREALARALNSARGSSEFIHLVKRFQLADHYAEVLSLAQSKPAEQLGVEAISALLELKQWDLLSKALKGDDTVAAIATAEALGNSSNGAINGLLMPVIKNADVNIDVRRAAVKAASKVNNAAAELVKLVDEKTLDPELEQTVAAALHSAPSREARAQAQRLFPLPPSKDNMPTPPISELTKLKGDMANGRMVFFSTGTCHKCHVVDSMGREVGPNLSEIGSKLSREAMFESVLYPSAGISHNFELWTVLLTSGTTVNGMLTSNTDEEVSIKGDDALVRTFKKVDVEELVKQKISMMPADLQKTMTTQELADIVEYMQSLKKK
ncbi:MAG TPA: NPCBM/NEW2 domain-containing protein [Planctomycetaceae bacterium]|nr:NPCBM/NEW2 domain-containing protein [Planctomycetaceae bacterium]